MASPEHHHEVFSPKNAPHLDTRLRRLIYHPEHLAERFVKPGDRVMDFGCGPGFFTREFARRVGRDGTVFSVDLQREMLDILRDKLEPEGLMPQIALHQCKPDSIDLPPELNGSFDVIYAIFVVHEVPDPARLFGEFFRLLKPGGIFFYTDPIFVVPGKEFREKIALAEQAGFHTLSKSFYFLNRSVVLKK